MHHHLKRRLAALCAALLVVGAIVAVAAALPAHASGGISKDSSAPASVLKTNSTSTTEATASFSPPANSLVVVAFDVAYDSNTTTTPTVTVKDSASVSYTAGPHAYDGGADGSFLFEHYYATAPGSITVTATRAVHTGAAMLELDTYVLDGTNSSQSGAATMTNHSTGSTAYDGIITPTTNGSVVVATAAVGDSETPTAHNLSNYHVQDDANDGSSSATGNVTSNGSPPGAETIGWTGASSYYSLATWEVLPSPASLPPAVTTNAASSVGSTTATLNGTVNPEGQATTYQFDYGPTTSYGTSVPSPAGSAGSGSSSVPETYNLTGLTAGDTYHYRIEATNATGTTYGADQQFTDTGGGTLLTWSPPACGGSDGDTCTTINLSATGSQNPTLASNVDYKLIMPSTPIAGGTLTISGGHNVQIIGGEIDLNNPCTDSCSAEGDGAIYITDANPGEVYIEGVLIHNKDYTQDSGSSCSGGGTNCSTADGIDVNVGDGGNPSTPPTMVFQNIRVDGISGCSGGSDHADVLQPYNAGTATIDVDHLTGTTNCQGMTLDPDYGYSNFGTEPTYNLKNVNIDVFNNPYSGDNDRYGYWLTYGTSCPSGPVSLSNVYEQEPDGTLAANSVWPDTAAGGGPSACQSSWSSPTLSFPHSSQISGVITEGQPSGGDYVPVGTAGIGYVSPGYQP